MTAGYSGTPLAKKLGMNPDLAILFVDAPDSFIDEICGAGITAFEVESHRLHHFTEKLRGREDIVHLFTNSLDTLRQCLIDSMKLIKQGGAIWVSWYKKAARLPTEITEDIIRDLALPLGLVDIKVCAVDEKWSGLKLVIRRENRV